MEKPLEKPCDINCVLNLVVITARCDRGCRRARTYHRTYGCAHVLERSIVHRLHSFHEVKVYGGRGPHEVNVLWVPPAGYKSIDGVTRSKLRSVWVEPNGDTFSLRGALEPHVWCSPATVPSPYSLWPTALAVAASLPQPTVWAVALPSIKHLKIPM